MVDLKKELSKNSTILLVMSGKKYNTEIVKNVKKLATKNSVCYVTLNKTSDSLKELFEKKKVNLENITFVDCITKSIKNTAQQGYNVYFISSPGALTELSLVITKFMRHKFEYLIFDSLTNMVVYQNQKVVVKFVSSLINKIKDSSTKAVFYGLKGKEQEDLVNKVSTFVDNVLDVK